MPKKGTNKKKTKKIASIVSSATKVTPNKFFVKGGPIPKPQLSLSVVKTDGLDHVRVSGVEVFTQIVASTTLQTRVSELIGPLNDILFPKLSAVAALYEKWRPIGQGFRFHYLPQCNMTRTGNVACYVETDPGDTAVSNSVIEMLNQKYSGSVPMFDPLMVHYPPRDDAPKWYFCQGSGDSVDPLTNRSAFAGRLNWFTQNASSADSTTFGGFLALEYTVELCTFRPPDSTGFSMANETSLALPDSTAVALQLSDNESYLNTGARALRYIYDSLIQTTESPAETSSDRRILLPPLQKDSLLTFRADLDELAVDTPRNPPSSRSSNDGREFLVVHNRVMTHYQEGQRIPLSNHNNSTPLVEEKRFQGPRAPLVTFLPWRASQDAFGDWFYQTSPGGDLIPYVEGGVNVVFGPLAAGDVAFYITYKTIETGVEIVLFNVTLSAVLTAVSVFVGGIIFPALAGYCKLYLNLGSAGGRFITSLNSNIGGASGGGDDPSTVSRRRIVSRGFTSLSRDEIRSRRLTRPRSVYVRASHSDEKTDSDRAAQPELR